MRILHRISLKSIKQAPTSEKRIFVAGCFAVTETQDVLLSGSRVPLTWKINRTVRSPAHQHGALWNFETESSVRVVEQF